MTRQQYLNSRRLIRTNGRYALRWFDAESRAVFERLCAIEDSKDWLDERAEIVEYCELNNLPCTPRHTTRRI